MARPSCKEHLLDAAEAVVVEQGGARLTLDAVAEQAGVSKGGLLYHFPTKEALLQAMIARHIERVERRRAAALEEIEPGPEAALRADLQTALTRNEADMRVSAALLAVVANDPKLLAPAVAFHRKRFARYQDGASVEHFARRAMVSLAADGLFFLELFQLAPFTQAERCAISTALLRMADDIAAETTPGPVRRNPK